MTTLTAFVEALQELTVTGVVRQYTAPPLSLNTADMPAQWVQNPEMGQGPMTFKANGGWPALKAQLIIAVQPVAQDGQAENWSATLTICDALDTALRSARPALGPVRWQPLRPGVVTVAGIDYWAAITEVTSNG